ncbi:MAG TPA: hypothetical protein VFY68_14880, partial [Nitrososphaeraceae archaeon]|nr:hypothetical protein [Nitrososphaeraceae archaeon]
DRPYFRFQLPVRSVCFLCFYFFYPSKSSSSGPDALSWSFPFSVSRISPSSVFSFMLVFVGVIEVVDSLMLLI